MKREDILIEADELLAKIDDPNLRIYDATIQFFGKEGDATAHEIYMDKHIPQAAFFDHNQFSESDSKYMYMVLPEDELGKQIGKAGISADAEVVVYTSSMLACATRAWWVLRYAGHNNVRVLNGGLAAWEAIGGAVEQGDKHYEPASFTCQLRSEMFVGLDDVQSALGDENISTTYTLSLDAYGGKMIPQTTCLPLNNLAPDMATFLPNDELAKHLEKDKSYERVINYCGGGIGATINAMAQLIVGNENVAVYDGSLSEWMGEGLPTIEGQEA